MAGVVPFHVLSAAAGTGHGELAIALGAEFGAVAVAALDAAIEPIAADLAPAAELEPAEQLLVAEAVFARHLHSEPRPGGHFGVARGLDDLLPHEVARRRRGHELTVTFVALEAARRAGLRFGLVASPGAVFVGHPALNAPVLLSPAPDWHLLNACDLDEPKLAWQCAHEAVSLLLKLILSRARETGMLGDELRASELFLHLPVEGEQRERLQRQLATVRARFN